jgi:hypothetical protein
MNQNKKQRSFMQVLPELRNGALVHELTEAINEAVMAVADTQGVAKIQLNLTFKQGQGAHNALAIADAVKLTLPKKKNLGSIFFADDSGNLTRNNPDQLELQGISIVRHEPKRMVETVDQETGEIQQQEVKGA